MRFVSVCLSFFLFSSSLLAQFTKVETVAFPAEARSDALTFGVGDYLYTGTGITNFFYLVNDWWRYHYPTDTWEKLADLPFAARQYAMGFTYEKYIYVFGGWAGDNNYFNDFWRFDTEALEWKQLDSLPGSPRWAGFAFTLGAFGYVGGGDDTAITHKDFYRYSFMEEKWERLPDLPFGGRMHACTATNGLQAMIGLGTSDDQEVYNDVYLFNGINLQFQPLPKFPKSLQRVKAVWDNRIHSDRVLFFGGQQKGGRYNPYVYTLDLETKTIDSAFIPDIPTRRSMNIVNYRDGMAISFGLTDSNRFIQSITLIDQDLSLVRSSFLNVYPNPVNNSLLALKSNAELKQFYLYNLEGKQVFIQTFNQGDVSNRMITIPSLPNGIYTSVIESSSGESFYRKIMIKNR